MQVARNVVAGAVLICAAVVTGAAGVDKGRIAFGSDRSGSWQIYTMNPDGTDQVQVTNLAPTDADGLVPVISPDGRQILFTYGTEGADLYVVNVDGTELHAITQDLSFAKSLRWQ